MPPITEPVYQLDYSPPRCSEIEQVVRKTRAASVPGPNGVLYRLLLYACNVLRFLWKQIKLAWKNQTILTAWQRAGRVIIPKEKDALKIDEFRQIS